MEVEGKDDRYLKEREDKRREWWMDMERRKRKRAEDDGKGVKRIGKWR